MASRSCGQLLVGAMALSACGGELARFDDDAGFSNHEPGTPVTSAPADGGKRGSPDVPGYCLYETCGGLSACSAGKTCPTGDGCNTCSCSEGANRETFVRCTRNPCACP
jgi:hypothetical protein